MTITESIEIKHLPSGELQVKLTGDHEFARGSDEATVAYLITSVLWLLLRDGTVFKKITERTGIVLEGSLKIAESEE